MSKDRQVPATIPASQVRTERERQVALTPGARVRLEQALDEIEEALDGPCAEALRLWRAQPPSLRNAEKAPLFSRLVRLAERLR